MECWTFFPDATLTNHMALKSDHSPIHVNVYGFVNKRFRFENMRLAEADLEKVVHGGCTISSKLALMIWSVRANVLKGSLVQKLII